MANRTVKTAETVAHAVRVSDGELGSCVCAQLDTALCCNY